MLMLMLWIVICEVVRRESVDDDEGRQSICSKVDDS
jgi:hypothetical protein